MTLLSKVKKPLKLFLGDFTIIIVFSKSHPHPVLTVTISTSTVVPAFIPIITRTHVKTEPATTAAATVERMHVIVTTTITTIHVVITIITVVVGTGTERVTTEEMRDDGSDDF